jgi:hypothetical protein
MFKIGEQMFVVKSEVVGQPSVVSGNLVQSVGKQFVNFRCQFPQTSPTILYEIITVRLGYHKFCARCVPKMLTGANKSQRMVSFGFAFLERHHKYGNEFLSHIVRITGDET